MINYLDPIPEVDPDTIPDPIRIIIDELTPGETTTVGSVTVELTEDITIVTGSTGPALDIRDGEFVKINSEEPEWFTNIESATEGFTFIFNLQFTRLDNNILLFTSGGHEPDSTGVALAYAYGLFQLTARTTTKEWTITFEEGIETYDDNKIEITFDMDTGIAIQNNGRFIARSSEARRVTTEISSTIETTLVFGGTGEEESEWNPANIIISSFESYRRSSLTLIGAGLLDPGKNSFIYKMSAKFLADLKTKTRLQQNKPFATRVFQQFSRFSNVNKASGICE